MYKISSSYLENWSRYEDLKKRSFQVQIDRQKLAGKGFFADMTHFRSSERLGQRDKVVEHTHKP